MKPDVPAVLSVYAITVPQPTVIPKPDKKQKKKQAIEIARYIFDPIKQSQFIYSGIANLLRRSTPNEIILLSSEQANATFIEAHGERWIVAHHPQDAKQYYIRHPKTDKSNILITANTFGKYIYDEYCAELINYCRSHCKAKKIIIYSEKESSGTVGADINVKAKSVALGANARYGRKNLLNISAPNGLKPIVPQEHYFWIDSALKSALEGLPEGGAVEKEISQDFSFGVDANFLKFINADLDFTTKFIFTIKIKC